MMGKGVHFYGRVVKTVMQGLGFSCQNDGLTGLLLRE